MSGKQLPPPSGGPDLTALLRNRHARTEDDAPPAPPEPRREPSAAAQRPARAKAREMDRRSWYMPKVSADALADAVDELHYATRQPKHVVLAALVSVALRHVDEAQQHIEQRP